MRGMALRIGKCIGGDAQTWGSLGHGIYLGTLWWGHWGMDHFRSGLVTVPCSGSGPAQKTPNPDGRGGSGSPGPFSSTWQCFIIKKSVLARNFTTLFSIKKHFPHKNRQELEASVGAPFQSVVTMASFSSADASAEISTSACMVLIKAAK